MSARSVTSSDPTRGPGAGGSLAAGLLFVFLALTPGGVRAEESKASHLDEAVLTRGCGTCHRGHGKAGTPMLMEAGAESCLMCHGGVDPRMKPNLSEEALQRLKDLRTEFDAPFGHRMVSDRLHQRRETLPETDPGAARHVTCLDCHEAHNTRAARKRLDGDTDPAPSTLGASTYLYEVCLRCHGDSANLPAGARNIRTLFHPGNRSYHPVTGPRRSVVDTPSLRRPWSAGGQLSCLDCHGDGEGKPGAHGSSTPGMLRNNYLMADNVPESELSYRLCYRCHDRTSILADESFSLHRLHLESPRAQTSCKTCHNAHGSRDSEHLIEFDPVIVRPTGTGEIRYESQGAQAGACTLTCHEVEHAPANYCPPGLPCDHGSVKSGTGDSAGTPRFRIDPIEFPPGFGPGAGGGP